MLLPDFAGCGFECQDIVNFGINAQRLSGQRLGVGRYIEYLLKNWSGMLGASEAVSIFVRDGMSTGALAPAPGLRMRQIGPRLNGLVWEQLVLPVHCAGMDVLFGPSYTLPLAYQGPCVVATHSVNETQAGAHSWWYFGYKHLYRHSARKANLVIVPSESTKVDLQRLYGIPAEKIEIVPQGADDDFRPLQDDALMAATRRKLLGVDKPYVLFVGKLSQRRNIPLLLEAFALVKRRTRLPHQLVLFGPNHLQLPIAELAGQLGVANSVLQTDGQVADHRELIAVYNAADVFVHPSSYEGWSMTTMEALACGTAVIATNRGGLGEVAAGHALTMDKPTVSNLADAIELVLTDDRLRQELRIKARKRGSAFRWQDTSRRTLDVLRRVASMGPSRAAHAFAPSGGK